MNPKILFLAGQALGHVGRVVTVASQLRDSMAADITIAVVERTDFSWVVEEAGFNIVRLAHGHGAGLTGSGFPDALQALLRSRDWDCIVLDINPLRWLALIHWPDVPRVFITNSFVCFESSAPTQQAHAFQMIRSRLAGLRRDRGLPPLVSVYDLFDADLLCLADPISIASQFTNGATNHVVCGPCNWEATDREPAEVDLQQATLLMSMGSTGPKEISETLIQRLRDFSGAEQVVFVGSQAREMQELGVVDEAYEMVNLARFYEQSQLIVSHGGTGSTYAAHARGVPTVILPRHRNHGIFGRALEEIGVSIALEPDMDSEEIAFPAFQTLSDKAAKFASEIGVDGPSNVVECIRRFL